MHEVDGDVWVLGLEDVKRWQCEDGTCYNHTRRCADGLDNNILANGILALHGRGETYCDDGDRDGCFEDLTDFEAEIRCGCGEDDCHDDTHDHTVRGDLRVRVLWFENRLVVLSWLERTRSVLRKLDIGHMF